MMQPALFGLKNLRFPYGMRTMFATAIIANALLWLAPTSAQALEVPRARGHVNDLAGLLDRSAQRELENRLTTYEETTGHQFAVLIVPSLEGQPIEDYAMRVVEAWKLGSAKNDNGLLMLISLGDRAMRIEVGYGLEGVIPDAVAARIIRDVLTPAFAAQDFNQGTFQAFDLLMRAGSGEKVEVPKHQSQKGAPHRSIPWWVIIAFFVLAPPLLRVFGLGMLLGGSGRHGGGGFGGFGGGGFGGGGFSGGGGGFGGGGASGRW